MIARIVRIVRIVRSADFIQATFGIALIAGIATCSYATIADSAREERSWRRVNAEHAVALCAPLYARAATHADSFAVALFRPLDGREGQTCADAAAYLAAHPAPTEQR